MASDSPFGPYRPPGRRRAVWGWIGLGLLAAAVLSAGAWSIFVQATAARYDATTLCNVRGPTSVTVLLLDATDQVSPLQKDAIQNRFERYLAKLHANERLEIYGMGPDRNQLKPVFSKCRPLAPDEVDSATGNKRLAQERFEKLFKAQLSAELNKLLSKDPDANSPIMESIQAIAVRSFQATDLQEDAPGFRRQLIIASDLLQNGEAGSHYDGVPDFGVYRETEQFRRFRSDLRDVQVVAFYIQRASGAGIQGTAHWRFWEAWFNAQDADVEREVPIEG